MSDICAKHLLGNRFNTIKSFFDIQHQDASNLTLVRLTELNNVLHFPCITSDFPTGDKTLSSWDDLSRNDVVESVSNNRGEDIEVIIGST